MVSTRSNSGRFVKGNPGGPGRPKLVTERAYLDILRTACTPETWGEIVKKAVEDAKAGDSKAREWLSIYLVGKPSGNAPTLKQMAIDELAGNEDGISTLDVLAAGMS
jgi:hypothetical protein